MAEAKFNLYNKLGAIIQTAESPLSIPVSKGVDYSGYKITHLSFEGSHESKAVEVPDFTIKPEETTKAPEETTKAPQETTKAPQETTKAP